MVLELTPPLVQRSDMLIPSAAVDVPCRKMLRLGHQISFQFPQGTSHCKRRLPTATIFGTDATTETASCSGVRGLRHMEKSQDSLSGLEQNEYSSTGIYKQRSGINKENL